MHNLCVFWLFFSKITFNWKLFSDCCDEFDYPGSIVYLSCFIYKHKVYTHDEANTHQKLSISLAYFLASLLHVAWHLCIIKILIHHSFWNEYTFCVLALIKDPKYNEILNKTKKIFKGAKIHHNDSRFA